MASTPTAPRQQIFKKLEQALELAKRALQKEPGDLAVEDLGAVLFLARDTAEAIRKYSLRRALLVEIYATLVEHPVDFTKLDTNWDGKGTLPSVEFTSHLGTIAAAVAGRLSDASGMIENPFDGERTTCADLRIVFGERTQALGVPHAAQVFATA